MRRGRFTGTAATGQQAPAHWRWLMFFAAGMLCLGGALLLKAQERESPRSLDEVDQMLASPSRIQPRSPDILETVPDPAVPVVAPDAPLSGASAVLGAASSGPIFLNPVSIADLLADSPAEYNPAEAPTLGMLEGTWRELLAALRGGRLSVAASLLDRLDRLRFLLGIENLAPRSTALIHMARQALRNGDRDLMRAMLDDAERLSPRLASVPYARFRLAIEGGDLDPGALMEHYRSGIRRQMGQIITYLSATSALFQAAVLAGILAALVIALVLLYRTHMALSADLAYWLRAIDQVPLGIFRVMVLLAALVPPALGAGATGTAACWLVMSAMYVTKRESAVLFVALAVLAVVPPLARSAAVRAAASRSTSLAAVVEARYGEPTKSLEAILERRKIENPADTVSWFSFGMVALKRRNLDAARESFSQVLQSRPAFWQAAANLAVVEALDGEPMKALELNERAMRDGGEARWLALNRARILELAGADQAEAAQRAISAAQRELGPDNWSRWTRPVMGTGELKLLATFPLSDRHIWDFHESLAGDGSSVPALYAAFTGSEREATLLVLLCAVVVLAIQLLRPRVGHSYVCESCGTWIRAREGQFLQSTSICSQCIAVLYRAETVEPMTLLKKRAEIKSWQRHKRRLWSFATFIAPGSGEMGRGRLAIGAVFLAVSSVLASFWVQGGILTGDPWSLLKDPSAPFRVALITSGLLFYLAALWHFFDLEES